MLRGDHRSQVLDVVVAVGDHEGRALQLLAEVLGLLEDLVGVRGNAVRGADQSADAHCVQGGSGGEVNVDVALAGSGQAPRGRGE